MLQTQRWGLRGRSIALCLGLILATVATIVTALSWQAHGQAIRSLRQHARLQASALSYNAEPAILLHDERALQRVVASAATDRDLTQAAVLGPDGRPEAVLHPETRPTATPIADLPALPDESPVILEAAHQLLVIAPIERQDAALDLDLEGTPPTAEPAAGPVGYVALTYSLDGLHAERNQQVLSAAALGLLVAAVGSIVTLFCIRTILRPLRDLVQTTRQMAGGERGRRVREQAVGEIGELGHRVLPQRREAPTLALPRGGRGRERKGPCQVC